MGFVNYLPGLNQLRVDFLRIIFRRQRRDTHTAADRSMVEKSVFRSSDRACSFDGGHGQSFKGANRTQTGIDRTMLGFFFLFVPLGKNNRAGAAPALSAAFFSPGQPYFLGTQKIE